MKLADRLARRKGRPFHSAIVTSFAVEYGAVEEILLPQLMASGATNILLIADERMASFGLQEALFNPVGLGREYTLWTPPISDGLFHPKIILQLGRDGGRAFVSSANATAAGIAGNIEVGIEIECDREPSPEQAIIRAIWTYLDGLVTRSSSAPRDALSWAIDRTDWLIGASDPVLQTRSDGTLMAFLAGPEEIGIGRRFADLIDAPVEELIVVSPFWDGQLGALNALSSQLNPRRILTLLDSRFHDFPTNAPLADSIEIIDVADPQSSRFLHAKLIIASTATHDHVLAGSANCTTAALGNLDRPASNAEACLYRRLPRGSAIDALSSAKDLNLRRWLETSPTPKDQLTPNNRTAEIPLGSLEAKRPGIFEIDQGYLVWVSPAEMGQNCSIILRDLGRNQIHEVKVDETSAGAKQSHLLPKEIAEKARYASLECDQFRSTLAPITHRMALRAKRREIASGSVARALSQFSLEADFGLFLHQALDALFKADFETDVQCQVTAARSRPTGNDEPEPQHTSLTYEDFMRARPKQQRPSPTHEQSFSGLHSDSVRGFLNNLIGISTADAPQPHGDDSWMNTGDEPSPNASSTTTPAPSQHIEPEADDTATKVVDPASIERALKAYLERLRDVTMTLGAADVLRLRFWLMFLLYNARCPACPGGLRGSSDEQSWPRAVVRIVSAFFVGRQSPITRLMVSRDYLEMPADFLECWATIEWTLLAIEAAVPNSPRNRQFLPFVPQLRTKVQAILGLTTDDRRSEVYEKIILGLNQTLGRRLEVTMADPLTSD